MKKLPIVFPVLLALFFSANESRADLFGNILKEVDKAVGEIDKAVDEINKEVDKPKNTSKETTNTNTSTSTSTNKNTSKEKQAKGSAQEFVDHISHYYGVNQYFKRCNASGAMSDDLYNNFKNNMKKIIKYWQEDAGISDQDLSKYKKLANQKGIKKHEGTIAMMEMATGFGKPVNSINSTQWGQIVQFCEQNYPQQNAIVELEIQNINKQSNKNKDIEPDF
tara:strand:- start:122 stop:787 length:666 start_codon:yes stop_codon:yes gene_type:complete